MTKNEVYRIMKISKNRFLQGFGIIVVLLGIIRCSFPNVVKTHISILKSDSSCHKTANKSIENADGCYCPSNSIACPECLDSFQDACK